MSNDFIAKIQQSLPELQSSIPDLKKKTNSEYASPCPKCGGDDRFIVDIDKQKFYCRQCEWKGDIIDYHQWKDGHNTIGELAKALGIESAPPAKKQTKKFKKKVKGAWGNAESDIEKINRYFSSHRGITFNDDFPLPKAIRYATWKHQNTGEDVRSIIFAVTNLKDKEVVANQRIYLQDDFSKIKPMMKGEIKKHGRGIWFHRDRQEEPELIIGEGAETVLSAMFATGINGVAGLDAGKMGAVHLPDSVTVLYILVDEDIKKPGAKTGYAGQKASIKLAEQFEKARDGNIAYLITPSDTCFSEEPNKLDFNDLLMKETSR